MNDTELHNLVMSHLTGTASAEQNSRLNVLLSEDRENIERYIQYVRESALLSTLLGPTEDLGASNLGASTAEVATTHKLGTGDVVNIPLQKIDNQKQQLAAPAKSSPGGSSRLSSQNRRWWGMATAATLLAFAFGLNTWINKDAQNNVAQQTTKAGASGHVALAPRTPNPSTVAKIIRKVDCIWEDDKWQVATSPLLTSGQTISISQGEMEIEFDCGAKVTLEGPARFRVSGPKRGLLYLGSLSAVVSERARGFSIKTPTTNVVDLGTSFSLSVNENGNAEIHVTEGEVLSQPLNREGESTREVTKLFEHDSLLVSFNGDEPIAFKNPSDNPRNKDPLLNLGELWDVSLADNLILWLAADRDVKQDKNGDVKQWGDLLYGGNVRAESAWQVDQDCRPQWIPDAIGGKPALRFDGEKTYLVTDSLATSDNQTVLFVVKPALWRDGVHPRGWGYGFRQILNYNGPPNLSFRFPSDLRMQAHNYVGEEDQMLKHSGQLSSEPLPADVPIVVRYTYAFDNHFAELAINGQVCNKVAVDDKAAVDSPKYIGCHWGIYEHFEGDFAELLIFNEALPKSATEEVTSYLAKKYGIPLEASGE